MKKKSEKKMKPRTEPEQTHIKVKTITEIHDETYRQINKVSFQQNFHALIGHYKGESSASR